MSLSPERCLDDSPVVDTVGATDGLNEELDDNIDASCSDDSSFDDYSDSDDEPIENDNPHLYQPLYSGAEITACGAICAIMQFCTTYKLSYTAIGGLLRLLIILCPTPNHLPRSFYMLKKFFEQFQSKYTHSKYCIACENLLSDCACINTSHSNIGHIVHLDIQKPLEIIISGLLTCSFSSCMHIRHFYACRCLERFK